MGDEWFSAEPTGGSPRAQRESLSLSPVQVAALETHIVILPIVMLHIVILRIVVTASSGRSFRNAAA
eukprot:SAG31_NODE_38876_length_292_cov_1.414508_1_plen_66_part_10